MPQHWLKYENVAKQLLQLMAEHFELDEIQGKQLVSGRSGTIWEIDAKGTAIDSEAFVIIECRRWQTARIKQEHMAAIAYRISDSGAVGGITVSPLELQKGARLVAATSNIQHVTLNADCSVDEYVMQFLNKIFIGAKESLALSDAAEATVIRAQKSRLN